MRITRPRATKASQITWDLAADLVASLESGGVNELNIASLGGLGITDLPVLLMHYFVTDDILYSHDAKNQSTSGVYVKVKTITLTTLFPSPTTVRVVCDIRSLSNENAYEKIYKNGVAYGAEQLTVSAAFATTVDNLVFAENDDIQSYVYVVSPGTIEYEKFRIRGKEADLDYHTARDLGAIGVADPFDATSSTP